MTIRPLDQRTFITLLLDLFSLEVALILGYALWIAFPWHGNYQYFEDYSHILWILPLLAVPVFYGIGLYKQEIGILGIEEQSLIFKAIWILYLGVFGISFFYRDVEFSRLAVFYSIFIAIFLVSIFRFLTRFIFARLNAQGIGVRNALIYGAGYHGQRLERWIRQSPKLGIHVAGFLDDDLERLVRKPQNPPCIGGFEDLKHLARKHKVSILFIAHRKLDEEAIAGIFQSCKDLGIQCWMIPVLYHFHVERAQFTNIGGIPLVGFRSEFTRSSNLFLKDLTDKTLAIFLLPLLVPIMLLTALGIFLTSGTPIFFRQKRVGLNGKKFVMLKMRTLKKNAPANAVSPEISDKKTSASMTTPFGAFLRKTGLDEVPQIINVLRGDMSFVGPRPEMPFIVAKYGPLEKERLTVKPGITGLWQISEDRKRLLIHENMDYDLYYVEHMSFNLDLAILVKTVVALVTRLAEKPGKVKSSAT